VLEELSGYNNGVDPRDLLEHYTPVAITDHLSNGSEEAQYSLDSTCRKLHRFLIQPQR
jgi:hypothetical protein